MLLAPANPNTEREREREMCSCTSKSVVERVTSTLMDLCFIPLSFPRPLSSPSSNFSLVSFFVFFLRFSSFFFVVSPALGNTEFRPTFFRGQPKKLAEIGQFFFYSLPKKQKIPPSKVVQFYKTFIFALEVLRIKRRIYP